MLNHSQTIAITGATGFVGAHLVRYFSRKGHKIIAIGRQTNPPPQLRKYATWQQSDITKPMQTVNADIVIHCAGRASDSGAMHSFVNTNVEGTKNVWKASMKCKKFVFISSSSVYASGYRTIKEEDANLDYKLSNYGKSKLQAEQYLLNQDKKNKLLILRPRAIYGTHDRVLLPRILNLVKKNKVLLPGNLDIMISMTHINNLTYAIEALVNHKKGKGIYNISDPQPYHLRKVVTSLLNTIHNKELRYKSIPIALLKAMANINQIFPISSKITHQSLDYMSKSFVLDISKIKGTIPYQGLHNFESEVSSISQWVNRVGIDRVRSGEASLPWAFNR